MAGEKIEKRRVTQRKEKESSLHPVRPSAKRHKDGPEVTTNQPFTHSWA